jgi:hypothetical protein
LSGKKEEASLVGISRKTLVERLVQAWWAFELMTNWPWDDTTTLCWLCGNAPSMLAYDSNDGYVVTQTRNTIREDRFDRTAPTRRADGRGADVLSPEAFHQWYEDRLWHKAVTGSYPSLEGGRLNPFRVPPIFHPCVAGKAQNSECDVGSGDKPRAGETFAEDIKPTSQVCSQSS